MLTISNRFLKLYKANFLMDHRLPFSIQYPQWMHKRRWRYIKNQFLTDSRLQSHLEGRYWVAITAEVFTRWVCFDVDVHGTSVNAAKRRVRKVLAAFPDADPLIFSSPGGGFYIYYLLDKPNYTDRTRTYVKNRLQVNGISLASGKIELFPKGIGLRAPLGGSTLLLNSKSLKPVFQSRWHCILKLNVLLRSQLAHRRLQVP